MTDLELLERVEAIGSASGRIAKEEALTALVASPEGRELVNFCYNPFLTWGITCKKMPDIESRALPHVSSQFSNIKGFLTQLSERGLTGNDAKQAMEMMFGSLNPAAQKLLWLCLNKDLKVGIAEGSIKAVDPSLIPIFAVMRAHAYDEKHVKAFPVAVEPKMDGHRVTFISKDGSGGFFTRTGKVIQSLDHMVEPTLKALRHWVSCTRIPTDNDHVDQLLSRMSYVRGTPQIVLDGEMMSDQGFAETSGALRRQDQDANVRFHIFDMMSWEEFDAMGAVETPYMIRRAHVQDFIIYTEKAKITDRLTMPLIAAAHSHDEIMEIYQKHRAAGYEGAMVKSITGFYHKKKSREWLKLKNEDTEDLPVIGVFQGQKGGKYENTIGGLIVDRNGVEVRVSGLSEAMRAEIWEFWQRDANLLGIMADVGYEGASFKDEIEGSVLGTLEILGWLCEVEYHEVTPDGSLRHPRFVRWRDDKTGEVDK